MDNNERFQEEIFSVKVKAGKRTYYLDVKSTRAKDYYVTLTEKTSKSLPNGGFTSEKHKIFLYKEDIGKVIVALNQAYDKMQELMPEFDFSQSANLDIEVENDDTSLKWD